MHLQSYSPAFLLLNSRETPSLTRMSFSLVPQISSLLASQGASQSLLQWLISPEMPISTTSRNHTYPQEPTLSVFQTKPKKDNPQISFDLYPPGLISFLCSLSQKDLEILFITVLSIFSLPSIPPIVNDCSMIGVVPYYLVF